MRSMTAPQSDDLGRPRVVVGVSPAQLARHAELGGKYKIHHPPEAQVVVVDAYRPPNGDYLRRLIERDVLQPGAILVRSPFGTGEYALLEEAPIAFEQEKIRLIAELCRLLGASRVKAGATSLRVDDDRTSVKASGGRKVGRRSLGSLDASVDQQQRSQWSEQLAMDVRYPAAEPDFAGAEAFIRAHNLDDYATESLLKARSARATTFSVTVSYETKKDSSLQAALKVTLPTVSGGLSAKRSHSSIARISMDLNVSFEASVE